MDFFIEWGQWTFKEFCQLLAGNLGGLHEFLGVIDKPFPFPDESIYRAITWPEPTPTYLNTDQKFIHPDHRPKVQFDNPDAVAYGGNAALASLQNVGVQRHVAIGVIQATAAPEAKEPEGYWNPNYLYARHSDLSAMLDDVIDVLHEGWVGLVTPGPNTLGFRDTVTELDVIQAILRNRGESTFTVDEIAYAIDFFNYVPTVGDVWNMPLDTLNLIEDIVGDAQAAALNLVSRAQIDMQAAKQLVEDLYHRAGVHPDQIPDTRIADLDARLVDIGLDAIWPRINQSDDWWVGIKDERVIVNLLNRRTGAIPPVTVAEVDEFEEEFGLEDQISFNALWPITAQDIQNIRDRKPPTLSRRDQALKHIEDTGFDGSFPFFGPPRAQAEQAVDLMISHGQIEDVFTWHQATILDFVCTSITFKFHDWVEVVNFRVWGNEAARALRDLYVYAAENPGFDLRSQINNKSHLDYWLIQAGDPPTQGW